MTVQQLGMGASSDRATHWHGIDWARCHREIRRLQARIVKAQQAAIPGWATITAKISDDMAAPSFALHPDAPEASI